MVQTLIDGIAHEVNFWRTFVTTARFLEGWASLKPNPELHAEAAELIAERMPGSVLDVGSGPVSILRGTVPEKLLTAADPLGKFYEGLMDYQEFKITPPAAVRAEDLEEWIRKEKRGLFDIVHCSNALDHTMSPWRSVECMKAVLKPGGLLIIQGFVNEADNEKWQGLHQWNIAPVPEGLIIKGRHHEPEQIAGKVITKKLKTEKIWYIYTYEK